MQADMKSVKNAGVHDEMANCFQEDIENALDGI